MSSNTTDYSKLIDFGFILAAAILAFLLCYFGRQTLHLFTLDFGFGFTDLRLAKTHTGMVQNELIGKLIALALAIAHLMYRKPKKSNKISLLTQAFLPVFTGGLLFFLAFSYSGRLSSALRASNTYCFFTITGFSLLNYGCGCWFRKFNFRKLDQFDTEGKKFPMERKCLSSPISVNIPAQNSHINIVAPTSSVLVSGSPNSGKSFVFIMEGIIQLLRKGFTAVIYDWKEGELSTLAFNVLQQHKKEILAHNPKIKFLAFNPANPIKSVRINPVSPKLLQSQEDCIDAGVIFYYNLNLEALKRKGDYFIESGKVFVTMLLTFLRYSALKTKLEKDGKPAIGNCCTIPHLIALSTLSTGNIFKVCAQKKETKNLYSIFRDAHENGAEKQLAGQVSSGKVPLAFLSTPGLFWALSGDDISLDVNNPDDPKILTLINKGVRREFYSPVLGLILCQTLKQVNQPGKKPCHISVDELYTVYIKDLEVAIATARSNKVAPFFGVQDYSMLVDAWGKEKSDVIINTCGSLITSRVKRETAKEFQEMFGKTLHDRISQTVSKDDTTQTHSQQLDYLLPASELTQFSKGEFAGVLADTMTEKLPIKIFRDFPVIDLEARKQYTRHTLPDYINVPEGVDFDLIVQQNYDRIYKEAADLLTQELTIND